MLDLLLPYAKLWVFKHQTSDHQAADFHLLLFVGCNMTHIAKPRTPSSATPNTNLYLGPKLGNNSKARCRDDLFRLKKNKLK